MVENFLSIDLEEWYQTNSYSSKMPIKNWDKLDSGLTNTTYRILDVLREFQVKATFFILGYNAKSYPRLIRLISKEGHELGVHGYYHRSICEQTPSEFKKEVEYSKKLIEDQCQEKVIGFRAPNWSITPTSMWALDIILQLGFRYDSSMGGLMFKRVHSHLPEGLVEIPRSSFRSIPFGGGFFLRAYPYRITREFIRKKNNRGEKIVVYIHPWEISNTIRDIKPPFPRNITYNFRMQTAEKKFIKLLHEFKFNSVRNILFRGCDGG